MSGVINKVKNALHSDNSTTATGTHTTGTHAGTHAGTHTTGVPEGVAGPHGSRTANAADPRVDSDLDGRAAHHGTHGTHTTGTGNNYTTGTSGLTGNSHTTGGGLGHNTSSGLTGNHATTGQHTAGVSGVGPHNNATLNKLNPTVDSDLSHVKGHDHTLGSNPQTSSHTGGLTGHNTTHSTTAGSGLTGHSNAHSSGLTGTSNTHSGGLTGNSGKTGGVTGHSAANPHTSGVTGAGHNSNTTAGPHKSDLLNKLDPRVDSDLSKSGGHVTGSNTHTGLGGSKTHA